MKVNINNCHLLTGGANQRPDDSGYESMGTQTQSQTDRSRGGAGTWARGGGTVTQPRGGRAGTVMQPRGGMQPIGQGGGTRTMPRDGGGGTGMIPRGGGGGTSSWQGRDNGDGNADNRGGAARPNFNMDNNQRNKRPHPPDNPDDGEEIYCQCSEPAAMRTVRKESANKGINTA
jgi:hypothetical protein